eukprot:scaffold223791_cov21-Tisochrysis_lutea.AAC.1
MQREGVTPTFHLSPKCKSPLLVDTRNRRVYAYFPWTEHACRRKGKRSSWIARIANPEGVQDRQPATSVGIRRFHRDTRQFSGPGFVSREIDNTSQAWACCVSTLVGRCTHTPLSSQTIAIRLHTHKDIHRTTHTHHYKHAQQAKSTAAGQRTLDLWRKANYKKHCA